MKNFKSEKGAITMLVLISLVFLTTFLISSYAIMSNKMKTQKKVISDTKEIYGSYNLNEMYESYFDKSKENVPAKATKIKYIESTGTQYIDTGVKLNQNSKVELELLLTDGNGNVFGSRTSATENNFTIILNSSQVTLDFQNYSNNRLSKSISTNSKIYCSLSKDEIVIDDTKVEVKTYSSFETPDNAYIFDVSGNSWIKTKAKARLYYCKIYDGDTLVRDFVPILDKNNIACLYDNVENKCYYNSGEGEFNFGD